MLGHYCSRYVFSRRVPLGRSDTQIPQSPGEKILSSMSMGKWCKSQQMLCNRVRYHFLARSVSGHCAEL